VGVRDDETSSRLTTWALFLLRAVAGFLLVQAGASKLFGWYGGADGVGPAPLGSLLGVGALLEIAGGVALMLGVLTRPVALVLATWTAALYALYHAPHGRWPIQNDGEAAVLLCSVLLFFAAHGGGELGVDGLVQRRRTLARLAL
jgi:putative oxidoreductase